MLYCAHLANPVTPLSAMVSIATSHEPNGDRYALRAAFQEYSHAS